MELKKVKYENNQYFLNQNQYFWFNQKYVKEALEKITFPLVIMDTEFFNHSHDVAKIKPALYDKNTTGLIYTLSFSVVKNYQQLLKRNNDKTIITYSVKRKHNDPTFNFNHELDAILTKFFNQLLNQKVSTMLFAGKANDEIILNQWVNKHKKLFNNKVSNLIIKEKNEHKIKLNIVDIYPILEEGISFHDDPNNEKKYQLKKGSQGEDTVKLPSLKQFYEFINLFPNLNQLKEEDDIYKLCIDVLKFYSIKFLKLNEFKKYQKSYRQAIKHCHNDVLKLIYLVYFLYVFATKSPEHNPFVEIGQN